MNTNPGRFSPSSELVEVDLSSIDGSPLINHDIAPTKISQRTWTMYKGNRVDPLLVGYKSAAPHRVRFDTVGVGRIQTDAVAVVALHSGSNSESF